MQQMCSDNFHKCFSLTCSNQGQDCSTCCLLKMLKDESGCEASSLPSLLIGSMDDSAITVSYRIRFLSKDILSDFCQRLLTFKTKQGGVNSFMISS